jgi:hypothetical protein
VVDGASLENWNTGNRIGGSNPSLSASLFRFLYLHRIHTTIHTTFEPPRRRVLVWTSLLPPRFRIST